MDALYLTESIWIECLKTLDEYWDEGDTPYSGDFDFFPHWLFQYYDELTLVETIESDYITWKSEQHRLTPKYEILRSLAPLVKHYNTTLEEDD